MGRVSLVQGVDDGRLDQPVHLAHIVVAAFGVDLQPLHAINVPHDNVPPAARGTDGDVEHRVHSGVSEQLRGCGVDWTWALVEGAGRPGPASHPGNVGASARAMKTMGLMRLCLVAPSRFPSAEATAMAAGADDVLYHAGVHASLPEALTGSGLVVGTSARRAALPGPRPAARGGGTGHRRRPARGGGPGVRAGTFRPRQYRDRELPAHGVHPHGAGFQLAKSRGRGPDHGLRGPAGRPGRGTDQPARRRRVRPPPRSFGSSTPIWKRP